MSMTSPTTLIFKSSGRLALSNDEVPVYAVTSTDGVGDQLPPSTMTELTLAFYDFDASRWAFLPDGRAFVACTSNIYDGKYWIERRLLIEEGSQVTIAQIDLRAAKLEKALIDTFWQDKRTDLLSRKGAVIEHTVTGAVKGGEVAVAPGTYPIAGILDKRLLPGQTCPFSVFITVNGEKVAIVPDILWGTDDTAVVEAASKGIATKVGAAAVRAAFAAAPPPLRGYVPANEWLTDAQVHYLNQEWMGAACVLRRAPASEQEVAKAKADDNSLYAASMSTAGVRFGEDIFILDSYLGTGVEYHESVHKLSHRAMRDVLGQMFNEGVTEYFTWKVIADLASKQLVNRDEDQYGPQREAITELVKHGVTEAELAEAYFRGRLQPLYTKFTGITHGQLSLDGYAARLDNKNAQAAIQVFIDAVGM